MPKPNWNENHVNPDPLRAPALMKVGQVLTMIRGRLLDPGTEQKFMNEVGTKSSDEVIKICQKWIETLSNILSSGQSVSGSEFDRPPQDEPMFNDPKHARDMFRQAAKKNQSKKWSQYK